MKRQRNKPGPTSSSEKKIKMEEERTPPPPEEETVEDAALSAAAAVAAAALAGEEEMELVVGLGLKGADVDEQMSWGAVWLPFWDVEFVGRNYGVLFDDVVWDDDIWNLRTVTEVPRHV
ncbi:PREDICTED: uncharacterized protein LOC104800008 [Tarenaya hassleriana]|uniref:uncharacterized protein LOC104800008 n=1 Tax=Tarenaya hassleriana TaxID=28532 RepID=UPI00053C0965|nr:PREDICTED: uncharacterized protein LOC104800008 [Tarenaya hassleriana]